MVLFKECTKELLSNIYSTCTELSSFLVKRHVTLTLASGIGFFGVGLLNSVKNLFNLRNIKNNYVDGPPTLSNKCTVFLEYFYVHLSIIFWIVEKPISFETYIIDIIF